MAPHDPLFKSLLRNFFAGFLRLVAPELAARLDLSAVAFLDKEFVDHAATDPWAGGSAGPGTSRGQGSIDSSWFTSRSKLEPGAGWDIDSGIIIARSRPGTRIRSCRSWST